MGGFYAFTCQSDSREVILGICCNTLREQHLKKKKRKGAVTVRRCLGGSVSVVFIYLFIC